MLSVWILETVATIINIQQSLISTIVHILKTNRFTKHLIQRRTVLSFKYYVLHITKFKSCHEFR